MGILEILLSGIVGAFSATILLIWHQDISEKIKDRKKFIDSISDWLDGIYTRLQLVFVEKDLIYRRQNDQTMTSEEYNAENYQLRVLLFSRKIIIQANYIYGQSDILEKIYAIRNDLLSAARIFWGAQESDWEETHANIQEMFTKKIDPDRDCLTQLFVNDLKKISIGMIIKNAISKIKINNGAS